VRYIWEMLRAASDAQEAEEKAARADPADADWRSALPVRRPSVRRL
jgi:hypothetical protein